MNSDMESSLQRFPKMLKLKNSQLRGRSCRLDLSAWEKGEKKKKKKNSHSGIGYKYAFAANYQEPILYWRI